jgi:Carboxyl transferase domain
VVRLEQRVIQEETAAYIILTGCPALNRVLVHEVYLSNSQRGGTKIMDPNRITQLVVLKRCSWNQGSPRLAERCASCAWTTFTDN